MASFAAPSKVIIEKSRGGDFNGTGIVILAGFGPVGDTEKENTFGLIMNNFRGHFFQVFVVQNRIK